MPNIPSPLVLTVMYHPAKMLSHCCTRQWTIKNKNQRRPLGDHRLVVWTSSCGYWWHWFRPSISMSVDWNETPNRCTARRYILGVGWCWRRRGNPTSSDTHRHRIMAFATPPPAGHLVNCIRVSITDGLLVLYHIYTVVPSCFLFVWMDWLFWGLTELWSRTNSYNVQLKRAPEVYCNLIVHILSSSNEMYSVSCPLINLAG